MYGLRFLIKHVFLFMDSVIHRVSAAWTNGAMATDVVGGADLGGLVPTYNTPLATFFRVGFAYPVFCIAGFSRLFRHWPLFHDPGSWRWVFPRSSQIDDFLPFFLFL